MEINFRKKTGPVPPVVESKVKKHCHLVIYQWQI